MKLNDYKGYEIHVPTSGGKAGKGHNLTSTIQIRLDSMIKKQIRFDLASMDSRARAIDSAKRWITANPPQGKAVAIPLKPSTVYNSDPALILAVRNARSRAIETKLARMAYCDSFELPTDADYNNAVQDIESYEAVLKNAGVTFE